ncbi:hypothetical protein A2W67_02090 [Candidatus Nomurabacteria bacterium RIFCSPLOWO2_02_40_28]|nr:MAG: hypothetical protein A2W50_00015 [Candidatus Nomurabacteria bacterium RIFCSPHIGHO2_02_40_30]OGI79736.1 MAG: hypothetical protein A2W43_03355 [Candidatus Nomurabacteria bacterium RIFCSPHIGHO2_12_40_11]OGI96149.1 MAG: hypothetical protein A2W67_02090 [Candidatus Nomurabacteria bacterium RIFCSPLOWO2_02_40_28]OGI99067.1 MAG: hypothetical protein A2W78_00845 [Candidatus Nomurabacteria bacterium RIFCSPLOWO2_12_40_14]
MKKSGHKLFISGPVNLDDNIRESIYNSPDIGHRELEFVELLKGIREKLLIVFKANKEEYSVLIFTGSGTSAMEAVMAANVHEGKKALIVSNGEFGERFAEIADIHHIKYKHLKYQWGEPVQLDDIDKILKNDSDIETVVMTYHETSIAILNPVKEIGKLAKRYNKFFIVDCISAVGGEPLDVVKYNIDFAIGSSAKALQSMPVLGIVCARKSAIKAISDIKPRCYYLDLLKHYRYEEELNQTPYTPAVPLFFALNQSLDNILEESIKGRLRRYEKNANYLRKGLKKMGLIFFLPEKYHSRMVVYAMLPENISYEPLHKKLRESGFIIYAGKGHLDNRAIHIANIGNINKKDIDNFLFHLEKAINETKIKSIKAR